MRRGQWVTGVLGVAGIMGLGAFLLADEDSFLQQPRYRGEPPRTSVSSQYFPRGESRRAGVPNYHEELFGTPRPSARPAAQSSIPEIQPGFTAAPEQRRFPESQRISVSGFPGDLSKNQSLNRAVSFQDEAEYGVTSASDSRDMTPPRAAVPVPGTADELIPADFRSHFERGRIRRILAEDSQDSPFQTPAELAAEPEADALPPDAPLHHVVAPATLPAAAAETDEPALPVPPPVPAPFQPEPEPQRLTAAPSGTSAAPDFAAASADGRFAVVQLHWARRGEWLVGQEGTCELIVKNSGDAAAADVVVEAWFPGSVRLVSASPHPDRAATHLVWRFESLEAGAEKSIEVKLIPGRSGAIEPKALARFTQGAATKFAIDEPRLEVSLRGPSEVSLGDPASQIVLVSNPGTGVARNVTVLAHIPAGLEHASGSELALDIGSLGPGETRRVRLGLAAAKGGRHTIAVEAAGDTGLRHAASAEVTVISPSLKLEVAGPGLRYKGRHAIYEITAINDGTAPSNNVRITHRIPEGFEYMKSDAGGSFDSSKQTVEWFIDRIEAGQSAKLTVELVAERLGQFVHHVIATSEQGVRAEQELAATVDGTASLVLEIVDLDDPVEVGFETSYEIRVRNEGSKSAANVGLTCELPQGVELLQAQGPAEHTVHDGTILFAPLATLDDGKTAIYRIAVRGTVGGHHRVRALLASDSITRPLTIEELTRFYGE